jgi:hypothetical protein
MISANVAAATLSLIESTTWKKAAYLSIVAVLAKADSCSAA